MHDAQPAASTVICWTVMLLTAVAVFGTKSAAAFVCPSPPPNPFSSLSEVIEIHEARPIDHVMAERALRVDVPAPYLAIAEAVHEVRLRRALGHQRRQWGPVSSTVRPVQSLGALNTSRYVNPLSSGDRVGFSESSDFASSSSSASSLFSSPSDQKNESGPPPWLLRKLTTSVYSMIQRARLNHPDMPRNPDVQWEKVLGRSSDRRDGLRREGRRRYGDESTPLIESEGPNIAIDDSWMPGQRHPSMLGPGGDPTSAVDGSPSVRTLRADEHRDDSTYRSRTGPRRNLLMEWGYQNNSCLIESVPICIPPAGAPVSERYIQSVRTSQVALEFVLIGGQYYVNESSVPPRSNASLLWCNYVVWCPTTVAEWASFQTSQNLLGEVYDALNGDRWSNNEGWGNFSISYCFWEGICCGNAFDLCVVSTPNIGLFDFAGNNMQGTIPDSFTQIGALHALDAMMLAFNTISVNADIITSFPCLSTIDFAYAGNVTGTLPSDMSMFQQLNLCAFLSTSVQGPIPKSLFQLPQISIVILGSSPIGGTIPPEIGQSSTLRCLLLSNAGLQGELPADLLGPQLLSFGVDQNNLTGTLDTLKIKNKGLAYLSLSHNRFTGGFPQWVTSLGNLSMISLSYNELDGWIPHFFVKSSIDLSNNYFQNLFSEIFVFTYSSTAVIIDISNNPFQASPLPTLLEAVSFDESTYFSGNLIVTMKMANCNIQGIFPESLFEELIYSLQVLDVSNNSKLYGNVPVNMLHFLPHFTELNIDGTQINNIDMSIPSDVPMFLQNEWTTYGTYSCPGIFWGRPSITVLGFNASFTDYYKCQCLNGYTGVPPHCSLEVNQNALASIVSPIVVLVCVGFTVFVLMRRRIVARRRKLKADRLLEGYAGVHVDGTAGGIFGMNNESELSVIGSGTAGSKSTGSSGLSGPDGIDVDLIVPFRKIDILRVIAHGASGVVSLGLLQNTRVAVKQFYPGMSMDAQECLTEARLHSRLRHPNVVLLLGVCLDPLCTLTEFMPKGSLYHVIQQSVAAGNGELRVPGRAKRIALDIACGMLYLHDKNILHRDMKSLNVLLDERWSAKVADFGASRVQARQTMTIGVGTMSWCAPEVIDSGHYSRKCDVYSYGIVLWEIVSGKAPFADLKFSFEVAEAVKRGQRPEIPEGIAPFFRDLIENCWDASPDKRPDFSKIVSVLEGSPEDVFLGS